MTLVSPPAHGGTINTRSFIPHVCHASIGVLAAVTAATACVIKGTIAHEIAEVKGVESAIVSVEHPSGEFSVQLGLDPARPGGVAKSGLLRSARLLMAGDVMVPANLWTPPASSSKEQEQ